MELEAASTSEQISSRFFVFPHISVPEERDRERAVQGDSEKGANPVSDFPESECTFSMVFEKILCCRRC